MKKVYQELASLLQARKNCTDRLNAQHVDENVAKEETKHSMNILKIMDLAPFGSGIDDGIDLIEEECAPQKLVFSLDFHHMNDAGYYDGWTEHRAIVTPAFGGIDIRITGRDRNGIKSYLVDVLSSWLEDNLLESYDKASDTMAYNDVYYNDCQ